MFADFRALRTMARWCNFRGDRGSHFGPKPTVPRKYRHALRTALASSFSVLFAFASLAQRPATEFEEVRRTEPVGANQLALRALYASGRVSSNVQQAALAFEVPAGIDPGEVQLEVRDTLDKGYHLKVTNPCSSYGKCEHRWSPSLMHALGIDEGELWPIVSIGGMSDKLLLPACLCASDTMGGYATFVFVPSRTINIAYELYDEKGQKIDFGRRNDLPAGLPISIRLDKADNDSRRYTLVVKHISSGGGDAERFSDTYTFLGVQP